MVVSCVDVGYFVFFFNDTATTEIYTLSLHDALPICYTAAGPTGRSSCSALRRSSPPCSCGVSGGADRKSTRLNSSHGYISYAVFCLKTKTIRKRREYLRANLSGSACI